MRKRYLFGLTACLLLGLVAGGYAQDAKPAPTVTLSVTDQAATEVATEIGKQLGVPVALLTPCEAKVTLELKEAKADEAVKAFAEAIKASWLRAYFLQPKAASYAYTPAQYLQGLTSQREAWLATFTEEERMQMMRSWFGGFGRGGRGGGPGGPGGPGGEQPPAGAPAAGGEQPPAGAPAAEGGAPQPQYTREQLAAMPGAGRSELSSRRFGGPGGPGAPGGPNAQGAEGAQGAQPAAGGQGQPANGQERRFVQMDDPVGQLIIPVRKETIDLEAGDSELLQTLFSFTTASGFLAVASTDLSGKVTLKLQQAPLGDALDQVATAVDGKWQPLYLLGVPRELSEAEVEARSEQRFQGRWAQFWAKSKEERAADIQQQVERLQRFTQMRQQNAANGQQGGRGNRMRNFGQRMLSRMERYTASLSLDQRRELLPLIRAMGQAVHGQ